MVIIVRRSIGIFLVHVLQMGAKQSKAIRSPFARLRRLGRKSRAVPPIPSRIGSVFVDDLILEDVDIDAEFGTVFPPSASPQLGTRASAYVTPSQRDSNLQHHNKKVDKVLEVHVSLCHAFVQTGIMSPLFLTGSDSEQEMPLSYLAGY